MAKELTEEQKAERAEARKEWYAKRNKALAYLKEFVDKSGDEKAKQALMVVKPSLYGISGGGGGGTSLADKFVKLVQEKKTVSENDVFAALKIGRKEAATLIRNHIKKAEPAQRVWIAFDGKAYSVAGTGPEAPKGWVGYVPAKKENVKPAEPAKK